MAGLEDTARPNYAKYLCKGLAFAKKVSQKIILAAVTVVAVAAARMTATWVTTTRMSARDAVVVYMQGVVGVHMQRVMVNVQRIVVRVQGVKRIMTVVLDRIHQR